MVVETLQHHSETETDRLRNHTDTQTFTFRDRVTHNVPLHVISPLLP